MAHKFQKYLYDSFLKLVEKYGFIKLTELNEEGAYSIEYRSDAFVIKLEKYFREFYVTLYKTGYPDNGVNLFNLLNYLNKASSDVAKSRFFEEEKDLDERYKKQFNYIADTIDENFAEINDFFKSENHESEMAEIDKFMINKYPNLFKRS
jgi:hypothetical protein